MQSNAKLWLKEKTEEIREISEDLKYSQNKFLKLNGFERIIYLSNGILENLEYLKIMTTEEIEENGVIVEHTT